MELTVLSSGIWYNKRQKPQISVSAWTLEKVLHQEDHAALEQFMKLGDGISILAVFWNLSRQNQSWPNLVLVVVLLWVRCSTRWPLDIPCNQHFYDSMPCTTGYVHNSVVLVLQIGWKNAVRDCDHCVYYTCRHDSIGIQWLFSFLPVSIRRFTYGDKKSFTVIIPKQ